MDCTCTSGGVEKIVAVHVQYTYCHSYCVLHGYSDRGEVEESVAVCVQYPYCYSYCVLYRYSYRGSHLHCVRKPFTFSVATLSHDCHMMYVCVGETYVHGL